MPDSYNLGPAAAKQISEVVRRVLPASDTTGVRGDSIRSHFPGRWVKITGNNGTRPYFYS